MSLFGEYIKETRSLNIIEKEWGYATYEVMLEAKECYIEDIYVQPEMRKLGWASKLADEIKGIARSEGCKILTGAVTSRTKNMTTSVSVLIGYGFKIDKIVTDVIFFKMEI